MARILGPRRPKRKPEIGLQLNRSNNFANGAIVFPMDGSQHSLGAYPSFKTTLVGAPAVGKFNGSSGVRMSSTSDYLNLGTHAEMRGSVFTQLAIVRFDAFATQTSTISESSTTVGSSTFSAQFGVDTATGRLLLVYDNSKIVSESIASGPIITTGRTYVVAVSYDGTNTALAIDGCDVSSTTSAATFDTSGSFFLMSKKGDSQESGRPCDIYLFGYWGRAMSRSELAELTRDPYQLFIGARSSLALPPSTAVTNATATTSQGQKAAASVALSIATSASTRQGQHVASVAGISAVVSGATKQGQKVAVSAAISISAASVASQAQSVHTTAGTATHGSVSASQAQSTSGTAAISNALDAVVTVRQVQSSAAVGAISTSAAASARQAQGASALGRIQTSASIATRQGQAVAAIGATSIDARSATRQGQTVRAAQMTAGIMSARIRVRAALRGRTSARPA